MGTALAFSSVTSARSFVNVVRTAKIDSQVKPLFCFALLIINYIDKYKIRKLNLNYTSFKSNDRYRGPSA